MPRGRPDACPFSKGWVNIAAADPVFGRVLFSSTVVYHLPAQSFADLLAHAARRSGLLAAPARVAEDFQAADSGVLTHLRNPATTRFSPPFQLAPAAGHLQPAIVPADGEVTTFVSICKPNRTWSVTLNLALDGPSTDQLIALAKSSYGRAAAGPILAVASQPGVPAPWPPEHPLHSIQAAQQRMARYYGIAARPTTASHFRCVEVRSLDSLGDAATVVEEHGRALYGILAGDEGWRHVDLTTVRAALDRSWGSRHFVTVVGMGDACLMLNLRSPEYCQAQSRFFVDFFGHDVPYFSRDYVVAGLEHGAFYAMELCAYRKCVVDGLHAMVEERSTRELPDTPPLLRGVRRRSYRQSLHRSLLRGMERLREIPKPELATLAGRIEAGSGLPERLAHLNQEIQAFEAEEQTNYMYRVNSLMALIAWIGLALTIASIAIAVLLAV